MVHCVPIEGTKAIDIFQAIDRVVVKRNLDTSKLKCVSFDGAANINSPNNGVYGLMKIHWKLPDLIYQHCRAHFNWLPRQLPKTYRSLLIHFGWHKNFINSSTILIRKCYFNFPNSLVSVKDNLQFS